MKNLLEYPVETLEGGDAPLSTHPVAPSRPHWLWWLFLAGVVALSCAGPTCAYH